MTLHELSWWLVYLRGWVGLLGFGVAFAIAIKLRDTRIYRKAKRQNGELSLMLDDIIGDMWCWAVTLFLTAWAAFYSLPNVSTPAVDEMRRVRVTGVLLVWAMWVAWRIIRKIRLRSRLAALMEPAKAEHP